MRFLVVTIFNLLPFIAINVRDVVDSCLAGSVFVICDSLGVVAVRAGKMLVAFFLPWQRSSESN